MAVAQLFDVHRELATLKEQSLRIAEALQQRDVAVASALDLVVEKLLSGDLTQSQRWSLAATVTNARLLLEGECEPWLTRY